MQAHGGHGMSSSKPDGPEVQGLWPEYPAGSKKYCNPSLIKEARASAAKACAVVARVPLLSSREGADFIHEPVLHVYRP